MSVISAPRKPTAKLQAAFVSGAQWKIRFLFWLKEQGLRRELRRQQINLYLAEQSQAHAQKAVAELRYEVMRIKGLQKVMGFEPEETYAPFKTWIVEARDITPLVNLVLTLAIVLCLVAAAAFYRGMLP